MTCICIFDGITKHYDKSQYTYTYTYTAVLHEVAPYGTRAAARVLWPVSDRSADQNGSDRRTPISVDTHGPRSSSQADSLKETLSVHCHAAGKQLRVEQLCGSCLVPQAHTGQVLGN